MKFIDSVLKYITPFLIGGSVGCVFYDIYFKHPLSDDSIFLSILPSVLTFRFLCKIYTGWFQIIVPFVSSILIYISFIYIFNGYFSIPLRLILITGINLISISLIHELCVHKKETKNYLNRYNNQICQRCIKSNKNESDEIKFKKISKFDFD